MAGKRKMTQETRDYILKLKRQGMPYTEISRITGYYYKTILKVIEDA